MRESQGQSEKSLAGLLPWKTAWSVLFPTFMMKDKDLSNREGKLARIHCLTLYATQRRQIKGRREREEKDPQSHQQPKLRRNGEQGKIEECLTTGALYK